MRIDHFPTGVAEFKIDSAYSRMNHSSIYSSRLFCF